MASTLFESKDFELRLYDGTGPTPNYVVGRFEGDAPEFSFPGRAPRPEQVLFTDRGQGNANMAYVSGPDSPIFTAFTRTFTFLFNAGLSTYVDAWGNPLIQSPWQVGGVTFLPVTSIGTRVNGRGVATACPLPSDTVRLDYLVNAYVQLPAPPGGGTAYVQEMLGLAPMSLEFAVDAPAIRVTIEVEIFGGINKIASFPAGTEVTPT